MKTRFVALAVAATMGLGSVSAFAQGPRHDGRGQAGWQHQGAQQSRGDWGRNHGYTARRYHGPSHEYRRDDGNLFGALVLGALTGALVGQAANAYNYNPPPAAYYGPPPVTYYGPPPAAYYNPAYGNGYYGN